MTAASDEVKMKHSFNPEDNGTPLTENNLPEIIRKANGRFPHVRHDALHFEGELGKSGVVVANPGGAIVAAVRSNTWIPVKIEGDVVEFGGTPGENQIERSFLFESSDRDVQEHAQELLGRLQRSSNLGEFALSNEGAGGGGSEPEGWLIHHDGSPYEISDGGEVQTNCIEETIPPYANAQEFLAARSRQILARKEKYPDAIVLDTSTLPTSHPREMKIGITGENGMYVTAITHKLWAEYMNCLDPTARQLMNTLGKTFGFEDWPAMHEELGNMAYLVFAASHLSIGLPHVHNGESLAIPEQEAIAVADISNSDFGTLAEMLMLSTPMVFGESPKVIYKGQETSPRDYRALMRLTLDTTHPADFIRDPETYRKRTIHLVTEGLSHTLDRSAYMSEFETVEGEHIERPVMHGRVRIRATSSEPNNKSGRVEFTGCSASPSLYDEVARNSLLQLMMVGAYEALSEGKHPTVYFAEQGFSSMTDWKKQKKLLMDANLLGFKSDNVSVLIDEGVRFAKRMGTKFPALMEQAQIVEKRLLNLRNNPAASLNEYVDNPQGSFAEVVQKELTNGQSALEVAKKIEQYQLTMASKFVGIAELF